MNIEQEMDNQRKRLEKPRIKRVVEAAKIEFDLHGIDNSKIKDIASRAGVGEASVYRYFIDKTDLINLVAYSVWSEKSIVLDQFMQEHLRDKKTALEMILVVYDLFAHLYCEHKDMLKFIEQYGNYIVLTSANQISYSFELYLDSLRQQIYNLIDLGIKDHSIDPNTSKTDIYDFFMLSLLPTVQNLAIRSYEATNAPTHCPDRLLENLKTLLMNWLQNKAS